MKITLESTTRIVDVASHGAEDHSVQGRVWEGVNESGVRVVAVITRIAAHRGIGPDKMAEFARDLEECAPPSPMAIEAIPLRLIV